MTKAIVHTHVCQDSTVTSFLTQVSFIFQLYLCEDSEHLGQSEIYVCICDIQGFLGTLVTFSHVRAC